MRYKQLVQKKLNELKNYIHAQDSLISHARSIDEIRSQVEKMLAKLHEVEVLINTENES